MNFYTFVLELLRLKEAHNKYFNFVTGYLYKDILSGHLKRSKILHTYQFEQNIKSCPESINEKKILYSVTLKINSSQWSNDTFKKCLLLFI